MPGLVGIVWNNRADKTLLDRMADSIKHEQWHQVDKYADSFFSGARVSLGIFNPEPQPLFNEDRTICIFMYGKIYDYQKEAKELKNRGHQFTVGNDADFCLHAYQEYGKSFVNSLNGCFVLAIYDLKQKKIIIANDRFSFRPLYYAMIGGKLLFASEVKAILEDRTFKKELNDETVADFFAFGEILGNKSFFKGVEALPPASVLTYDGGNISIEQYWDFNYEPDYSLSEADFIDQLVVAFTKAVEIRMRDNLRYGVALSGGLDSRTVLAAIDKSQRHRVTAFTFGLPGCDEIKVAKMVAQKAGVDCLVIELDAGELVSYSEEVVKLSDGMDTVAVNFLPYAFDRAREQIDVFTFGIALEVTLGGYLIDQNIAKAKSDKELFDFWYKKMVLFSPQMMAGLLASDYYAKVKDMANNSLAETLRRAKPEHPGNKCDYFSLRNHCRRFTILGSIIGRNKMEEAIPSFDNEFIEITSRIPPELRLNYYIYRKFLKRLAPELAAMPYQRTMLRADTPVMFWRLGEAYQYYKGRLRAGIQRLTGGRVHLPNERGYVRLDEWLKLNEKWKGLVRGLLLDEKAFSRGYFNRDYIEALIREHEAGKADHSQRLAYLATFELFLKMFVRS